MKKELTAQEFYNGFKNMMTQELHVKTILPVDTNKFQCSDEPKSMLEVEAQDEEHMLDSLVNKYVGFTMYYSLIDSVAAEHSARMQAMDAATNNAKEMVHQLTLEFNKAKQEAVTRELIEIVTAIEAMKK